jgi:hypothetical protein
MLGIRKTINKDNIMYREGELVEVKEYTMKTQTTQTDDKWIENWLPAVVVQWHGMTKMRTGIARFENLEVVSVLLEGKIRKFPTRSIRYPRD